jgi:hypothetical protein
MDPPTYKTPVFLLIPERIRFSLFFQLCYSMSFHTADGANPLAKLQHAIQHHSQPITGLAVGLRPFSSPTEIHCEMVTSASPPVSSASYTPGLAAEEHSDVPSSNCGRIQDASIGCPLPLLPCSAFLKCARGATWGQRQRQRRRRRC